ncbi:MAG: hypothetical protein CMG64_03630 [Candidatus Marinimicrobia bacterium]|nr:hypothetical protein [Candidatus Neomarinimicrobiota bacterium]
MNKYLKILLLLIGLLYSQIDTTLTIYGESDLFIGDSENPELIWISPNENEEYQPEEVINLEWNVSDESFMNQSIFIYFSQNLGSTFQLIEENISNNESYFFTLPDISSSFARFKIQAIDDYGNQTENINNFYFTIGSSYSWDTNYNGEFQDTILNIEMESNNFESDSKIPEITWQYPNGNEQFNQNETINLNWNGIDNTFNNESISIYFSIDLGSKFELINNEISNDSTVSFSVPEINSAFGRFKITAEDSYGNINEDKSDFYFMMGEPEIPTGNTNNSVVTLSILTESVNFIGDSKNPILNWLYPNGGEQFDNYEIITTQWSAEDDNFNDSAISIYLSKELGGYYASYDSENLPNLESYSIQLPHADEAFARFKVSAIDAFGNVSEDYSDNYFVIGDPFGNYNVNPYNELIILDWGWSGYQLILIEPEALSFMDTGDEIHMIDSNGIISDECSDNIYGQISTASATYNAEAQYPYSLYAVEGYDNCEEGNIIQPGYINGNNAEFLHYDSSLNTFYPLNANLISWSGVFGESPQDTLSFKFYDQSEDKTYELNEKISFTPDMIESDALDPYEFTYNIDTYENNSIICDFNINDYQYNGSISSTTSNLETGDQIAAFVGNECRGMVAAEQSPFNTTIFSLLVYGNTALSIIDSFSPIAIREQIQLTKNITEQRNLYSFNIYRNGQLIAEGLTDYYYYDNANLPNGEYCYAIALVDAEDNEMIISNNQCIEITSNEFLLGDLNNDTSINVGDLVYLVNIILNNDTSNYQADLNEDNIINVADLVYLVNIILNL